MATGDKIYIGVKSIQRQYIGLANSTTKESSGTNMYYVDYTINEVNPDKAILIVTGHGYMGGSTSYSYYETTARLLDATTVRVYCNQVEGSTGYLYGINFQVIEFY